MHQNTTHWCILVFLLSLIRIFLLSNQNGGQFKMASIVSQGRKLLLKIAQNEIWFVESIQLLDMNVKINYDFDLCWWLWQNGCNFFKTFNIIWSHLNISLLKCVKCYVCVHYTLINKTWDGANLSGIRMESEWLHNWRWQPTIPCSFSYCWWPCWILILIPDRMAHQSMMHTHIHTYTRNIWRISEHKCSTSVSNVPYNSYFWKMAAILSWSPFEIKILVSYYIHIYGLLFASAHT